MDIVGSEVSEKIRSAIKAKLMELGSYVDNELPDYIMVMVSNKRTKEQMDEDLQLFLGNKTSHFTVWLHQVLQKLQEVTVASLATKKSTNLESEERHSRKRKSSEMAEKDSHSKKSHKDRKRRKQDSVNSKEEDDNKLVADPRDSEKTADVNNLCSAVKSNCNNNIDSDCIDEDKATVVSVVPGPENLNQSNSVIDSPVITNTVDCSTTNEENSLSLKIKTENDDTLLSNNELTNKDKEEEKKNERGILVQSDDDDFINIKADAEAEAMLLEVTPEESFDSVQRRNSTEENQTSVSNVPENIESKAELNSDSNCLNDKVLVESRPKIKRIEINFKNSESESNSKVIHVADKLGCKSDLRRRLGNKIIKINSVNSDSKRNHQEMLQNPRTRLETDFRNTQAVRERIVAHNSRDRSWLRNEENAVSERNNTPKRIINIKDVLREEHIQRGEKMVDEKKYIDDDMVLRKGSVQSRVIALKKKKVEEEEEEDSPNQCVSSVVRVKPRPTIPREMQANKNLLLKAVADAQKSIARAPSRPEPEKKPDHLFTRKYRRHQQMEKIAVTLNNLDSPSSTHKDRDLSAERQVVPVNFNRDNNLLMSNLNEKSPGGEGKKFKQKIIVQFPVEDPEVKDKDNFKNIWNWLEGVNTPDISQENNKHVNEQKGSSSSTSNAVEESNKKEQKDKKVIDEESDEDEETLRAKLLADRDKKLIEKSQKKEKQEGNRSPQFVVTLDGFEPSSQFGTRMEDDIETDGEGTSRFPNRQLKNHKSVLSSEKLILRNSKGGSKLRHENLEICISQSVKKSSLETREGLSRSTRSIKEDSRSSSTCKLFPNCKFREQCRFPHPVCKYNSSCTRRDCPYSHLRASLSRRSPLPLSKPKVTVPRSSSSNNNNNIHPNHQQICKYFPNCNSLNCNYLHPKQCRYGSYCTKSECTYNHSDIV